MSHGLLTAPEVGQGLAGLFPATPSNLCLPVSTGLCLVHQDHRRTKEATKQQLGYVVPALSQGPQALLIWFYKVYFFFLLLFFFSSC